MKTFTLYGLRKPGEEARYIGITGGTLKTRLAGHRKSLTDDYRGHWMAKAKSENVRIEIIPYCVGLSEKEACELEKAVIAELWKIGLALVNTSPGGNIPPDATGKRHALGYRHTKDALQRIGQASLGNKYCLGFKHSKETKKKVSESNMGNTKRRGKKHSPEAKRKTSDSMKLYREGQRQESYLAEMWGGEFNLFGGSCG